MLEPPKTQPSIYIQRASPFPRELQNSKAARPVMGSGGFAFSPNDARFGTSISGGAELGCKLPKRPCPTNYAVALRYTLGCDVCHCPRLFDPVSAPKDSKAASAPTLSGFAFVPQCVPFSRTASAGLSNRSEVMRQTSPSSSPFRSKDAGRLSPTGKHSVCAQSLQMLMGFIHRQHIKRAKECPDQGDVCRGIALVRHLSATKKASH
jgi:hypothetical protein